VLDGLSAAKPIVRDELPLHLPTQNLIGLVILETSAIGNACYSIGCLPSVPQQFRRSLASCPIPFADLLTEAKAPPDAGEAQHAGELVNAPLQENQSDRTVFLVHGHDGAAKAEVARSSGVSWTGGDDPP
jgi:hypothetical protein